MSSTAGEFRSRGTFVVLATAVLVFAILQSLVAPVLSEIEHQLHAGPAAVTWVLTAYLLSASVFTPIVGRIGDRVGKKRMLVVALGALSVGSLLAALATGMGLMIVARVVQGIGGGILPLAFGIVRDEFPGAKVQGSIGVLASMIALGGGIGLVIAGPIITFLGYRWLFFIPMIIGAATAMAAWMFVPKSPIRAESKMAVAPVFLMSAWLIALLIALSRGQQWGWMSWRVVGLLVCAVAVAAAWIATENRSSSPFIDLSTMRIPAVWAANLVSVLLGFVMFAAYGFLPKFSQTSPDAGYGFGASIAESGLILLPWTVMSFAAGVCSARLVRRCGAKNVVTVGSLLCAGAMLAVACAHDDRWELYLANTVMGLGVGLISAPLSNVVVAAVPPEQTGMASGVNANVRTVGGAVGTAAMATICTAELRPDGAPVEHGYVMGFSVLSIVMLVGAAIALLIPRSVGRDPGGSCAGDSNALRRSVI